MLSEPARCTHCLTGLGDVAPILAEALHRARAVRQPPDQLAQTHGSLVALRVQPLCRHQYCQRRRSVLLRTQEAHLSGNMVKRMQLENLTPKPHASRASIIVASEYPLP